MCYFDFQLVIQVGMWINVFSLLFEFAAVLVLRWTQPTLPRPFVIPLANGALACYLAVPMGLCLFTMAMAFVDKDWSQTLAQQCQSSDGDAEPNYEGCPVVVTSGVLVLVLMLYVAWKVCRRTQGLRTIVSFEAVQEGTQPLLAGVRTVHAE